VTLDKIDLIDRKFSKSLLGYSRDDVDRLVAEAAETIGRLAEEKMALTRTVEELRREVAGYQSRETTLRDTLLTTQTIVEDVKAKARREAEELLDEARDRAAALVQETEERTNGLEAAIDALVQRKRALTSRFRDLLLATLDILDTDAAGDEPIGAVLASAVGSDTAAEAVPDQADPVPAVEERT
jgi:cell division initiation protein